MVKRRRGTPQKSKRWRRWGLRLAFLAALALAGGCGDPPSEAPTITLADPAPLPQVTSREPEVDIEDAKPVRSSASRRPTDDTGARVHVSKLVPTARPETPRQEEPRHWGSHLTLTLVDAVGRPIVPQRSEVLIAAHGVTRSIEIRPNGNQVRVPLDDAWLREHWPESRNFGSYWGRVLLKAPSLATLCSEPFYWSGSRTRTIIRFPGRPRITVDRGRSVHRTLVLRRPARRFLKLVAQEGAPLSGVTVTPQMFWSHANHCCYFKAVEEFPLATSDARGIVEVPDGDFEYAFTFGTSPWVLEDSYECSDPFRLVMSLAARETVIRFRERKRRPLELFVTERGVPAAGRLLSANLNLPYCGAKDGGLATTDKEGHISLPEFRPEQFDQIWFTGEGGHRVWSADPREERFQDPVFVELSARP